MRNIFLLFVALAVSSTLAIKHQPQINKLAQACNQGLNTETSSRRQSLLQAKLASASTGDGVLDCKMKEADSLDCQSGLEDDEALKRLSLDLFSGDQETKDIIHNVRSGSFDCQGQFDFQLPDLSGDCKTFNGDTMGEGLDC